MTVGVALRHGTCSISTFWQRELHVVVENTLRAIVGCTFGKLDNADQVGNGRNATSDLPQSRFFLHRWFSVIYIGRSMARGRRCELKVFLLKVMIGSCRALATSLIQKNRVVLTHDSSVLRIQLHKRDKL